MSRSNSPGFAIPPTGQRSKNKTVWDARHGPRSELVGAVDWNYRAVADQYGKDRAAEIADLLQQRTDLTKEVAEKQKTHGQLIPQEVALAMAWDCAVQQLDGREGGALAAFYKNRVDEVEARAAESTALLVKRIDDAEAHALEQAELLKQAREEVETLSREKGTKAELAALRETHEQEVAGLEDKVKELKLSERKALKGMKKALDQADIAFNGMDSANNRRIQREDEFQAYLDVLDTDESR